MKTRSRVGREKSSRREGIIKEEITSYFKISEDQRVVER